jgi:hypothetical protein
MPMRAAVVAPVLGAAAFAGILTGLLVGGARQEAVQRPAVVQLPATMQGPAMMQQPAMVQPGTVSRMGPTECH